MYAMWTAVVLWPVFHSAVGEHPALQVAEVVVGLGDRALTGVLALQQQAAQRAGHARLEAAGV